MAGDGAFTAKAHSAAFVINAQLLDDDQLLRCTHAIAPYAAPAVFASPAIVEHVLLLLPVLSGRIAIGCVWALSSLPLGV